jgi:anti-anti-sigma factor
MLRHPQKVTVVKLPAEIDALNCSRVQDALIRPLNHGAAMVVADATNSTFCDCAGVNALIRAHHRLAAAGAQLQIAAIPAVLRILKLAGTDQTLRNYPTPDVSKDHQFLIPDLVISLQRGHEGRHPGVPTGPGVIGRQRGTRRGHGREAVSAGAGSPQPGGAGLPGACSGGRPDFVARLGPPVVVFWGGLVAWVWQGWVRW